VTSPSVMLPPADTGFAPTAAPGQLRQRLPAGDGPSLLSRLGVVRDAGEATSQFYGSRQFPVPLINLPDGRSVGFGDDIHAEKVACRLTGGKRLQRRESLESIVPCLFQE
jgi:hypothetical protein